MARRTDDQGFLVFGAKLRNHGGRGVEAEVNDHVGIGNDRFEIVALIDLSNDFHFRNARGAGDERLTHPAFGTGDHDVGGHVSLSLRRQDAISTKVSWFGSLPRSSLL